jgi:type I pantothenate kinase
MRFAEIGTVPAVLEDLVAIVDERRRFVRPPGRPFLIGVTGSVAVGKSTMANDLAHAIEGLAGMPTASVVEGDSFLFDNQRLEELGLGTHKGFPESYDSNALRTALAGLREGKGVWVPVYSHLVYDVVAGEQREIPPRDIVIVEGLHLAAFARDVIDLIVHVEASEDDIERWFLQRFRTLYREALDDPTSFYRSMTLMSEDDAVELGRQTWRAINLVNLHENIQPARSDADAVVLKGGDHEIVAVTTQSGAWMKGW